MLTCFNFSLFFNPKVFYQNYFSTRNNYDRKILIQLEAKYFFQNFFSRNINSASFGIGWKHKYFNITKIFVLKWIKMAANQTEHSRLEQRSVIKVLIAEKCKPCEIYSRLCDIYREAYFSQKNVPMSLPLWSELKCQSMKWKYKDSPVKKTKISSAVVSK